MSSLCHAVTLKGLNCKIKTRDPSKLCHVHRKKAKEASRPAPVPDVPKSDIKPEEKDDCCVCSDPMPVSDKLGCGHFLCKDCCGKIRSDACPICRAPIVSKHFTKKQKALVQRRRHEDSAERVSESVRLAIQLQNEMVGIFPYPHFPPLYNPYGI
jgi:hypothetical protein